MAFLIKQKSDVIHLQYNIALYGFYSFVLLFALTLTKVLSDSKLVITLHDVKREHDMLKSLSVIFYKCYLVPFDLVYVHTNEACELLVQKHVVPSSKIKLIHHGLTSLVQHSSTESINKKHILFFGYIHIHKGIDDLIKSVEILLRSGRVDKDKIKLIVAGDVRERKGIFKYFGDKDHEYKQSLTKLVNDLKIVQHVEFIGYQETNNLHSLISNSFCVVLPYTNVEQSGVLNIALNFHKPIIATNIGGLKETLQDTGILVPPHDPESLSAKLIHLFSDNTYYETIVNGYERLRNELDINKINQQIYSDYQKIRHHE
jgi:glycosyltransferase involved in cell wall biosynthesis